MLIPQNKLAGHSSDVLENLTPQVRARVDALKDIQVREFSLPMCVILYYSIEFVYLKRSDLYYVCVCNPFFFCMSVYSPCLFECLSFELRCCWLLINQ